MGFKNQQNNQLKINKHNFKLFNIKMKKYKKLNHKCNNLELNFGN